MPESQRLKFVALNDKILSLGQQFASNAFPAVTEVEIEKASERLMGLPKHVIGSLIKTSKERLAAESNETTTSEDDVAIVSTTSMMAMHVLKKVRDEKVRELVFRGMNSASSSQIRVLEEMLETRLELAKLLGKKSYADLYLSDKMAKTPGTYS
jgi:mitochondrial intermediate peptidase